VLGRFQRLDRGLRYDQPDRLLGAGSFGWRSGLRHLHLAAGGTYSLAYEVPLTSSICTLTKIETVTPACAVANATYGQIRLEPGRQRAHPEHFARRHAAGRRERHIADRQPERTHHLQLRSQLARLANRGLISVSLAFTVGGIGSATPIAIGTVNVPAGFINYVGAEIRVCGKFTNTDVNSTVQNINIYYDAAGSDTNGSPVQIASLAATWHGNGRNLHRQLLLARSHVGLRSGRNGWVRSSATTACWNYYLAARRRLSSPAADTKTAAVGSLNLAGTAGFENRISIVHTNTTGNNTPQLQSLTIEVL
jgi:hypothetical protein